MKFVATKNGWIRDPGWVKIRIRDKHPGSATLPLVFLCVTGQAYWTSLLTEKGGGAPPNTSPADGLGGGAKT